MSTASIFRVAPYLALGIFAVGMVVTYARSSGETELAAARARLGQLRRAYGAGRLPALPLLFGCALLILLGHLAGLLLPQAVQAWNGESWRLYLLEGSGWLLAILALGGWAVTTWRHLAVRNGSAAGEIADSIFLSVLFVALGSGLLVALLCRWGSSWGAATLGPYTRSLAAGRPLTALVTSMPLVVQVHVFSTFALVAALPFTRLALPLVLAAHWLVARAAQPAAEAGRIAEAGLRRVSPASRLWPEPEYRWVSRSGGGGTEGRNDDELRGRRRPPREATEPGAAAKPAFEATSKI